MGRHGPAIELGVSFVRPALNNVIRHDMLLRLQNSLAAMGSGMREQERIANNLANANTVGYKRQRSLTETLEEFVDHEGAPRSVRLQEHWAAMERGALETTGNPLDLAIEGDGFFSFVDEATGARRYSRAGQLSLDAGGMLRNAAGHLVDGHDGPIHVPPAAENLEVAADGSIRVNGRMIGRLRVVRFENPEALRRIDSAGFDTAGMRALEATDSRILQGRLESSNVNPISEMTDMISHFRLFESQQKMLQTTDQILGQVTRELGRF